MVPAVFSLVNNDFFFISLDSWQMFSSAREKVEGSMAIATSTTRTMAMNLLLFPFPELWVKFLSEKQIQLLRVGFVPLTKAKVTSTRSRRLFPWSEYTFDIATSKSSTRMILFEALSFPMSLSFTVLLHDEFNYQLIS